MSNKKKDYSGHLKNRIMNEKQPTDYMQEDAFKEAVIPMLEQAYMQGYQAGLKDAEAAAKGETSEPSTWALVDE